MSKLSSVGTEMYKKACRRCRVVVLPIQSIAFLTLLLPSPSWHVSELPTIIPYGSPFFHCQTSKQTPAALVWHHNQELQRR